MANNLTDQQRQQFEEDAKQKGISQDYISGFLQNNPDDYQRIESSYGAKSGEHSNDTPSQAWNNPYQGRADDLYAQLKQRASQSLAVDPNDPVITSQLNPFRAEQERARRNYLSNVAEQAGPYANIRGEQRMAAEKVGQATSGFLGELLAREQGARRDEVAQALALQSGQLTSDQNRALQGQLGFADLNLRQNALNQSNDQFLRELALRQWQIGDNSAYQWATL